MSNKLLIIKKIFEIYEHLTSRRKKQLIGLICLMVLATLTEMVGIGAVFPFLTILVDPNLINKIPFITNILEFLGFRNTNEFALPITIFLFLLFY